MSLTASTLLHTQAHPPRQRVCINVCVCVNECAYCVNMWAQGGVGKWGNDVCECVNVCA